MNGINYISDDKGNRTAVQIDLKKYSRQWEDFYDGLIVDQRKNEERIPWEQAKKILKKENTQNGIE